MGLVLTNAVMALVQERMAVLSRGLVGETENTAAILTARMSHGEWMTKGDWGDEGGMRTWRSHTTAGPIRTGTAS